MKSQTIKKVFKTRLDGALNNLVGESLPVVGDWNKMIFKVFVSARLSVTVQDFPPARGKVAHTETLGRNLFSLLCFITLIVIGATQLSLQPYYHFYPRLGGGKDIVW